MRGLTQRTKPIKALPAKRPPEPGDVVWYNDKKGTWRTGVFERVVETGKFFGWCVVTDTCSGKMVKVLPENLETMRREN